MRHTPEDVIDRTQREFKRLNQLVTRLDVADWRRLVPRPETKDPWTVKDALAHIVYWKAHSARVFRGEKRPPELRGLEVNQINAVVYKRWRNRRPAEVVAWHKEVQDDVLRTLRDRPADWFGRRERSPDWPGDFVGHSAWHRIRDIEAALHR
ncbi:MAG TPA: DinB family protein [Candidatus Dormibacteraeota bacterium]|nr:DinB family protein [Candidatus Dormibacteraeota bacterium]